jgi:U3 small nucleolar RNA-associated protein 12
VYTVPHPLTRGKDESAAEGEEGHDKTPMKTSVIDLHGHRSDVRCVSLSSDGRTIATCSSDGLRLWSAATLACVGSCAAGGGYGVTLIFAPGNRYVILGTKEGRLQLIDTVSGTAAMCDTYISISHVFISLFIMWYVL